MHKAILQRSNPDGFVKPGELIDIRAGAADLSLQDRRVFNLLVEHAWPEIGEDKTHRIALGRLRGPHRGSERVADSVKSLMTTLVEVPTTLEGRPAVFAIQLLGGTTRMIDEDSPQAVLLYAFPNDLRRIIQDSRYWGRIKAYVMFSFTSKYALALYEALCLRANLRVREQRFDVDDFRALLGVEQGKYPGFPQLKQRVIDPAVLEVNALSDFNAEVSPEREGGTVRGTLKGFVLRWEKKSSDEWKDALDEQFRPKVGRVARIRGKVEKVVI